MFPHYSIFVIAALFMVGGFQLSYAEFNDSQIELTWTTESGIPFLIDADEDGIADGFYTADGDTGLVTFTKELGNGVASGSLTYPTYDDEVSYTIIGDVLYVASVDRNGTDCDASVESFNFTTGTGTAALITRSVTPAGAPTDSAARIYDYDGKPTLIYWCQYSNNYEIEIYNTTDGVLQSFLSTATGDPMEGSTFFATRDGEIWFNDNTYTDEGPTALNDITTGPFTSSNCKTGTSFTCASWDGEDFFSLGAFSLHTSRVLDTNYAHSIETFVGPWEITQQDEGLRNAPFLSDYVNGNLTKFEQIATLFPYILGMDDEYSLVTQMFDDGTNKYIFTPISGEYEYANIDTLYAQDRAYLTIGLLPGLHWEEAPNFTDGVDNFYLKTPESSFNSGSEIGGTITSGYYVAPTATAERKVYAVQSDNPSVEFWESDVSGTQVETIGLIKNAPSNAGYSIKDTGVILSNQRFFSEGVLPADNTFIVSLPENSCSEVHVRDLDLLTGWEYLGDVCASGVMPKTIPYLSSLAFTFWSLEWGVDSKYNQDANTFETLVRNDGAYSYYIDIYDNTDTLIESDLYSVPGGGVDLQTYNTTSYALPARVVYQDISNSTIYTTTIGFPGYLSAVSAQWGSLFTIEGFNMLFMIPIVFAAMFTRNSVSIGTGLTVVFIAALVWFGVLTISEPIIYLMVFIAILGMIAYKLR